MVPKTVQLVFRDLESGAPASELRSTVEAIAAELADQPRLTARSSQAFQEDGALASQDTLYNILIAGFTPSVIAMASSFAIREVSKVIVAYLQVSSSRRFELIRPDGTHFVFEGSEAREKTIAKLLHAAPEQSNLE